MLTILAMAVVILTKAQEIDVITYNVRLDAASDGADNWHHRKAEFAAYILEKNPDFLGVQEALLHQTLFLDTLLNDYDYIGVGRDDGLLSGEFMALFYRKTWVLLQDTTIWLSDTPGIPSKALDAGCFRTCTAGLFTNGRDTIKVFNTHFDHIGQKARILSAGIIQTLAEKLWPGFPAVVTGDFNVTPDNPVYGILTQNLLDVWRFHHHVEEGTFNGFKKGEVFRDRIDYIFINEQLISLSCDIEHPFTSQGRQLSDHFPVISKLKFRHE
ncbi:MAG: endonuclease/exonuclease/phosphatase family protein [Saprospiraceae bacterium]|nr:endonuclease/exonuclease/phosphatase family protein [Saprospiraceae bacterium]